MCGCISCGQLYNMLCSAKTTREDSIYERLITQIDFSSCILESFKVSSDSWRVAYVAWAGDKQFVVVDDREGEHCDGIVAIGGGGIVFDSPDRLHYLALKKGDKLYLVEEEIR